MQIKIAILCDKITIDTSVSCSGLLIANIEGVSVGSILDCIRPIDVVRFVGSEKIKTALSEYEAQCNEINRMDKNEQA